MRTKLRIATCLAAMCASSSALRAGPIDPKYIPPDAKWIVHVDIDAVAKSKLLKMLDIDLKLTGDGKHFAVGARPQGMTDNDVKKIAAIQDALGIKLPDDLHGVTLVGNTFDPEQALLLVNAHVDHDRLLGMVKLNPAAESKTYSNIEIVTWKENKGATESLASGAFVADDVIAIARSQETIEHAIDAATNKNPAGASSLLSDPHSFGDSAVMVYAASDALTELNKEIEMSPVMAPVKDIRVTIGEQGDDVVLIGKLDVKTAEAARQVRGALEGVKALATLASLDENADEQLKMLSVFSARAVATVDDTVVTVNWPVSMTLIHDLTMKMTPNHHHAATTQSAPVNPSLNPPAQ